MGLGVRWAPVRRGILIRAVIAAWALLLLVAPAALAKPGDVFVGDDSGTIGGFG